MRANSYLAAIIMLAMYLGLSDGHLAIYRSGDTQPLQVLPYAAAMFTEADQQALTEGIPFSTASDLSKLLEDYTS